MQTEPCSEQLNCRRLDPAVFCDRGTRTGSTDISDKGYMVRMFLKFAHNTRRLILYTYHFADQTTIAWNRDVTSILKVDHWL